jgi:hypothetical protein
MSIRNQQKALINEFTLAEGLFLSRGNTLIEIEGEPLMGGGIAGIELKSSFQLGFAAGKIPVVFHLVGAQVRMRARQCGIELQSRIKIARDFSFALSASVVRPFSLGSAESSFKN